MCLVVYMDGVFLFGPNEDDMDTVLKELQLDGFELKLEKSGADKAFDFLGINISEELDSAGVETVKLTQLGLIEKFLDCVGMSNGDPKSTPCTVQPLGSDVNGKRHFEE